MEITAPNSINSSSVPEPIDRQAKLPTFERWTRLTTRSQLVHELHFMQRIIDRERAQRVQALEDYDQVEAELLGLLSVDSSLTPNPTLIAMAHADLAIYADQLRAKCLVMQGGGHHGTAQTLP